MANSDLASRIKESMERRGLTQTALAKACGVSQPSVAKWLNGGTKELMSGTAIRVSQALGVNLKWLTDGVGTWDKKPIDETAEPVPSGNRKIPILGHVAAGLPDMAGDYFADEWITADEDYSDRAFALYVSGDSMYPSFEEGDLVIFDPDITPSPGDFVVAVTEEDSEATFKKYRVVRRLPDGRAIFELVPINPDYPVLSSIDIPMRIIGVMMEHRTFRKKRRQL